MNFSSALNRTEYYWLGLFIILGLISIIAVDGKPLFSDDSLSYLSGAESIIESGVYRVFGESNLHYPPGLGSIVAITSSLFGLEINQTVIAINLIAYILSSLLLYGVSKQVLGTSLMSLLVTGSFILNSFYLSIFDKFWSEPLFITMLFFFFTTQISGFNGRLNGKCMVLGIILGCMILVRYAGLFMIPVLAYCFALMSTGFKKWLLYCVIGYGAMLGAIVLTLLLLHVDLLSSPPRAISVIPFSLSEYTQLLSLLSNQVLPTRIPGNISEILFIALFAGLPLALYLYRFFTKKSGIFPTARDIPENQTGDAITVSVLGVSIICYFGFLALTKLIFDTQTPLDLRMYFISLSLVYLVAARCSELVYAYTANTEHLLARYFLRIPFILIQLLFAVAILRNLKFIIVERMPGLVY